MSQKVKISSFLKERPDRIKPNTANKMGLKRLEKIDFSGKIFINENKPTKTGMILIKKGDLVISGINVEKGALAVYQEDEDLLATIHYSSYSYEKSQIDVNFLKWFLKSPSFKKILLQQTKGGIKTELKPKHLLPLKVNLPKLNTQIKIRNKLNSIHSKVNKITTYQYENDNLINNLRQIILAKAISGKLVQQNINDKSASTLLNKIKIKRKKLTNPINNKAPFKLPKNWKWSLLENLLEQSRHISYGIIKLGTQPTKNGVPTLRCSDVKYRYINLANVRKVSNEISNKYLRTVLKGGEILINIRGTLGGCAIVPDDIKGYNIAREIAIIPLSKYINNEYILNVISSPYIQTSTTKNLRGIAYKGLNLKILRNFLIPIPPLNEQKRIVKKVNQMMRLCDKLEKQVKENKINSENLMNVVLKEAFDK